jgi:hypothetical protein
MLLTALLLTACAAQDAPQPAPLLPEGTIITQATGTLERASRSGELVLRLVGDSAPADGRVRAFTVLPSRVLEDLEAVYDANPNEVITVTGALTTFDGRNWLLPVHVERELRTAQREVPIAAPVNPDEPADAGDDESVSDLVADLESAVSTLRKGVRNRTSAGDVNSDVADDLVIVARRGRMTRDANGAWILLLDADRLNGPDTRLVLLPSKVLGELIRSTQRQGPGNPVLISGTLQHYRGKRYLIPSGWRTPHERPNLKR